MKKSMVLDCTLRDGGYCNEWKFGYRNVKRITSGLINAGVDIIECGFLTNKIPHQPDITQYNHVKEVEDTLPKERDNAMFVCMINYGAYDVANLPERANAVLDGIRVAFHKKDMDDAIEMCKEIKHKGYKVFMQPMLSMQYSDIEFIELITKCNEFEPYAFYIVDSFGNMKGKELTRLFYLAEHNLLSDIVLGFHSHNNMQLAYSNAQKMLKFDTQHQIIIDSSILGMGRGAGNLNTELFLGYLNESYNQNYALIPLLNVIDEVLNGFYTDNYWGYSLPNYLSASYNAHPNYAYFFDKKKTLTVGAMNELFCMMSEDKKSEYDKEYAEMTYLQYMSRNGNAIDVYNALRNQFTGKKVLLMAPGKNIESEKNKIIEFVQKNNPIIICVNFECNYLQADYIFISNLRRFKELEIKCGQKYIYTSNIHCDEQGIRVSYRDLLNEFENVKDNAGMMAIKLLIEIGIESVYIAGMDGYSLNKKENFAIEEMEINAEYTYISNINSGMRLCINQFRKEINIVFVTESKLK